MKNACEVNSFWFTIFNQDVGSSAKNLLSTTNSVNSKSSFGGTSPKNAKKIIEYAIKKYLK